MTSATFITFENTNVTINVKEIFLLSARSSGAKYILAVSENGLTHTFPFDENKDNSGIPPEFLSNIHKSALTLEHGDAFKSRKNVL